MHEGIHIALRSEILGYVLGIPITNTLIMSWVAVVVLVGIGFWVGKSLRKIPGRVQTFFEMLFGFMLEYMEQVFESRVLALRFFPLIASLFLFILAGSWAGLLPGVGGSIFLTPEKIPVVLEDEGLTEEVSPAVQVDYVHPTAILYPTFTDINMTIALALVVFFVFQIAGSAYLGYVRYAKKFFTLKSPLAFFVGIIELMSEFVRVVSFSFRLFGNMFAGKVLILVATFFVPFILPVPLMAYELFVGVVQASIFALLTVYFIKLAISDAQ